MDDPIDRLWAVVIAFACLGWFVFAAIGLPASLLLLVVGETLRGTCFATATLLLALAPFGLVMRNGRSAIRLPLLAFFPISMALFLLCFWLAPQGQNSPEAPAQSVFGEGANPARLSPAFLVPEIDQHLMGTALFAMLDPQIDSAQADRLRRLFQDIYRDMDRHEDYSELGNVMGLCYRDMFMGSRSTEHLYTYHPDALKPKRPGPAILFLHGSLGNFKGYQWIWKQFADAEGYAIVSPSFGMGNWDRRGGLTAIERAVQFCENDPRIDASRLVLVGLSNGGKGVSRALLEWPERFQAAIYLSPVLEPELAPTPSFIEQLAKTPLLLISGEADRRIPLSYLQETLAVWEREELQTQAKFFPDEDHFLVFSDWQAVQKTITDWLPPRP